jgi:hypothetical protein
MLEGAGVKDRAGGATLARAKTRQMITITNPRTKLLAEARKLVISEFADELVLCFSCIRSTHRALKRKLHCISYEPGWRSAYVSFWLPGKSDSGGEPCCHYDGTYIAIKTTCPDDPSCITSNQHEVEPFAPSNGD